MNIGSSMLKLLVLSVLVGLGSHVMAQSDTVGEPSTVVEVEKPRKPRIRRDSKIIENKPKVDIEMVEGTQAALSTYELRAHLIRMAKLEFIGELANKNGDVDMGARVNELLRLERKRYKRAVKRLKNYTQVKTQVGIP